MLSRSSGMDRTEQTDTQVTRRRRRVSRAVGMGHRRRIVAAGATAVALAGAGVTYAWTVGSASGVNQKLTDGTVGQEGPTYSPDGKFLWLPERNGLSRFPVNPDGTLGAPTTVSIPAVNGHSALVGQTRYSPDGSTLYA